MKPDLLLHWSGMLPMEHEHLFPVHSFTGICAVYDDGCVELNEWEAAFVSILCTLVYDDHCTPAVAAHLGIPSRDYDYALALHNNNATFLAVTLHLMMTWYLQPRALQDKITKLQCAFVAMGLSSQFQLAMSMYGRFMYHFSTHTAECTPPPSPAGAQGAPGENREEVVNNPMVNNPVVNNPVVNNPMVNNPVVNNPVVNNPEIDIVEVYDLTEDKPQAEDPPSHIGVQLHLQHPNLNPTVQLIRLPKK